MSKKTDRETLTARFWTAHDELPSLPISWERAINRLLGCLTLNQLDDLVEHLKQERSAK
jgi:hypothetical protein